MLKTGLYITIFILLCSAANFYIDYSIEREINDRSPYYLSFASIGAISLESCMDCWAKINSTSTPQDLRQDMLSLLDYLDISADPDQLQLETNHGTTILRYNITKNKEKIRFTLGSNKNRNESYYMLSFSCQDKTNRFGMYRKFLDKYRNQVKWTYYYRYSGEIDRQIASFESQQRVLKVIMKNMAVREPEVYSEGPVLGISGYSPKISNVVPAIREYGQKYNVEARIQNDEKAKKTMVQIGSPILLKAY